MSDFYWKKKKKSKPKKTQQTENKYSSRVGIWMVTIGSAFWKNCNWGLEGKKKNTCISVSVQLRYLELEATATGMFHFLAERGERLKKPSLSERNSNCFWYFRKKLLTLTMWSVTNSNHAITHIDLLCHPDQKAFNPPVIHPVQNLCTFDLLLQREGNSLTLIFPASLSWKASIHPLQHSSCELFRRASATPTAL